MDVRIRTRIPYFFNNLNKNIHNVNSCAAVKPSDIELSVEGLKKFLSGKNVNLNEVPKDLFNSLEGLCEGGKRIIRYTEKTACANNTIHCFEIGMPGVDRNGEKYITGIEPYIPSCTKISMIVTNIRTLLSSSDESIVCALNKLIEISQKTQGKLVDL